MFKSIGSFILLSTMVMIFMIGSASAEYFKASGQMVTKTTTSTGNTVTAVPIDGIFSTEAKCTDHFTALRDALPVWNAATTDPTVFPTIRFYVIGKCSPTGINQ